MVSNMIPSFEKLYNAQQVSVISLVNNYGYLIMNKNMAFSITLHVLFFSHSIQVVKT